MIRSTHSIRRVAVHSDSCELAHQRRTADDVGEQPGNFEVAPVLVVEHRCVLLEARRRSPLVSSVVQRAGGHAAGLVGVRSMPSPLNGLTVAGGVADATR